MTVLRNYNTLKQFKKEQVHPNNTICFIKDSGIIHSNGLDYTHGVMSSIDSMTDSDSVLFKFNQLRYQLINSGLMYDPNEKHTITFYVETARDFFLLPSTMSTDTVDKSAIQKDPTGPSERAYQLWLRSEYPWSGTINWDDKSGPNGDGIEEVQGFKTLYKGKVVYEWRMYNYDSDYKIRYSTGSKTNPKDEKIEDHAFHNHIFVDDERRTREVTFNLTEGCIQYISTQNNIYSTFPLIEMKEMLGLDFIGCKIYSIPFDSFANCGNLEQLSLSDTLPPGYRLNKFPESMWQLKKLKQLQIRRLLNDSYATKPDQSGIRNISNLKLLEYLVVNNCVDRYLKEYNDLPNLNTLITGNALSNYTNTTFFSKDSITEINPLLRNIQSISLAPATTMFNTTANATGPEYNQVTNLENLTTIPEFAQIRAGQVIVLHDWMDRAFNFSTLNIPTMFAKDSTSNTIDQAISEIYDKAIRNGYSQLYDFGDYIGKRNPWYNLKLILWRSGTANARPSGEYQAPTGFELGVSNGEPASAMEMLYVLANNYKYTITVNPGNGSKSGETLEPEEISVTSLEELDLLDNEEIEYTEESFDDPIYTEIIEDGKIVSVIDGDLTGAEVLTTQNIDINVKTKEEES